jgi:hypothetical protein
MGLITTLRQGVADRLTADPYFDDLPVLALKPKELVSELNNRINKLAIAGTVLVPRVSGTKRNLYGVYFDKIEVQVGWCENRQLNATGKDVEDICEVTAALLHDWTPANLTSPLTIDAPTIVEIPPENEADKKKRLLAVRLIAMGGVSYELPKVETPVINNQAGTITLTCATSGAAIFYRTDGKQPNPRVGSGSVLYSAPFVVSAGVTIKTRAFLAGYQDSAIAQIVT